MKSLFKILFLSFVLVFISSCSEDEPDCLDAEVSIANTRVDPYLVSDNGVVIGTLDGNKIAEVRLTEGKHIMRAEQQSGFLLFPTIVEEEINVFGCQDMDWLF